MSKKRWSWSEKELRKTRSVSRIGWYNAPKSFRAYYNNGDRVQTKKGIIDELNGKDGNFPRRTSRHSAAWDYW